MTEVAYRDVGPCSNCGGNAYEFEFEGYIAPSRPLCGLCLNPGVEWHGEIWDVPAWVLIVAGYCVGACLVAYADEECTCRCRGAFHGALAATIVSRAGANGQGMGA